MKCLPRKPYSLDWYCCEQDSAAISALVSCSQNVAHNSYSYTYSIQVDRKKPPPPGGGGFLFTMFPHQEPWVRWSPSKNVYQVLRGGSSYPFHRYGFGPPKFFSKSLKFSIIFYSTRQILGGEQCRKAYRSWKKEMKTSEITWKQLEPVRSISKVEKRRECVRALWYEQCPKNSFKRLHTVKGLGRCNAADRLASLRCNALFWGGLRPLPCCVAPQKVLYYSSLSHSHTISGNTVGENWKRGRLRSKLDWKTPVFYTDFFVMRTKYLYTCTVFKTVMVHW